MHLIEYPMKSQSDREGGCTSKAPGSPFTSPTGLRGFLTLSFLLQYSVAIGSIEVLWCGTPLLVYGRQARKAGPTILNGLGLDPNGPAEGRPTDDGPPVCRL